MEKVRETSLGREKSTSWRFATQRDYTDSIVASLETLIARIADTGASIDPPDVSVWPIGLRNEIFARVYRLWTIRGFNVGAVAEVIFGRDKGNGLRWVQTIMVSDEFLHWTVNENNSDTKAAAVADLALERAAHILSLDPEDDDIRERQTSLIRIFMADKKLRVKEEGLTERMRISERMLKKKLKTRNDERKERAMKEKEKEEAKKDDEGKKPAKLLAAKYEERIRRAIEGTEDEVATGAE